MLASEHVARLQHHLHVTPARLIPGALDTGSRRSPHFFHLLPASAPAVRVRSDV